MYIKKIELENFRRYGSGDSRLVLELRPGLTALVGENDSGKTTVVDALRYVLGTRDQDYSRVDEADFHWPANEEKPRNQISISLTFDDLKPEEQGAFLEHLTYPGAPDETPRLHLTWTAKRVERQTGRTRFTSTELRSGAKGDGPTLDFEAQELVRATYLRPLRDAEREMSAGRGSRLSQILENTKEIVGEGADFVQSALPQDPAKLSVLGVGDFTSYLLQEHKGIIAARDRLNDDFLGPLSFQGDDLKGHIDIANRGDDKLRRRQLLEKLALELRDALGTRSENRGLGSNNLMFMACELLLLGADPNELPLLLIEEPEAHLHPQRQLLLMRFLQERSKGNAEKGTRPLQILVTTHSPTLGSAIDLDNMVMMQGGRAYALRQGLTKLDAGDYRFLQRFLDATKANLFFARAVAIVEGDAEAILLPTLARLIGCEFDKHGVSVVNVGHVGLFRFARIFQRAVADETSIAVPVACIADMDVLPDEAPWIVGKVEDGDPLPEYGRKLGQRKWRVRSDYKMEAEWKAARDKIRQRADGDWVKTFVADHWTLEYDLAFAGLAREVWIAAKLAAADDALGEKRKTREEIVKEADETFGALPEQETGKEALASRVYAEFVTYHEVSKSIAAQHLCELLSECYGADPEGLRKNLPPYLVHAIDYLCPLSKDDDERRTSDAPPNDGGEVPAGSEPPGDEAVPA